MRQWWLLLLLLPLAAHAASGPAFNPKTPLAARISTAPKVVVEKARKDDHRPRYAAYTPTDAERTLVAGCLDKLPLFVKAELSTRLLGIYFIAGYTRGGSIGWSRDPKGVPSYYLLLDPQVLKVSLSEYLTFQTMALFTPGDPYVEITVDCGKDQPAIFYLLLRESVRIVDYAEGFSGAVPSGFPPVQKPKLAHLSDGVWLDATTPVAADDFPARTMLNYTGLDTGKAPSYDSAKEILGKLRETPFVSLRAARSLSDDLVEFVTFYYLTTELGLPYTVTLHRVFGKEDDVRLTYEPMKLPQVRKRFEHNIDFFVVREMRCGTADLSLEE